MSIRSRFRSLLLCTALLWGVFAGVPMRPEEIEELMRSMNQPKIEYTIPGTNDADGPELPG